MRTKTGAVLTTLAFAAALNTVAAQDAAPNDDAVQSRIRALEQELQDLKQTVNAQQTKTNENVKIEDLDQKIRVLERKQELAGEEAAAKAKTTPVLSVGEKGFSLQSARRGVQPAASVAGSGGQPALFRRGQRQQQGYVSDPKSAH